jgi:hypothetical protein
LDITNRTFVSQKSRNGRGAVLEPQDPQDKAYIINFTQYLIARCQKGPKAVKPQELPPDADDPGGGTPGKVR